jgi:adenine-specific DNA-methyltransferase
MWRFESLAEHVARAQGYADARAAKKALGRKAAFDAKVIEYALANPTEVVRYAQPDYKAVSKAAQRLIDESKRTPGCVLRLEREDHSDMYFVDGNRVLFLANKVEGEGTDAALVEPLTNWWDDIPWQGIAREGGVEFPKNKKPEKLIKRILDMCTEPGDWVLDSFAGSGTTGAVAHKMRRRWIMIERGEHCDTLITPRLRSVIDGTDASGITAPAGWSGGGGYRYYHLAPSLLAKDKWGNWVISKDYRAEMLAEAMCKLEGFTYAPDADVFWIHGKSTEHDFIYVTTQNLSHEQLQFISDRVGSERTLLICCTAFRAQKDEFANLAMKKIPQGVLGRCEWGREDYSLNVEELPAVQVVEGAEVRAKADDREVEAESGGRRRKAATTQELPLFAGLKGGESQ